MSMPQALECIDESGFQRKLKALIKSAGGVRALSREWGCSPSYISDIANGRRGPGEDIQRRVGWRKQVITTWIPWIDGLDD